MHCELFFDKPRLYNCKILVEIKVGYYIIKFLFIYYLIFKKNISNILLLFSIIQAGQIQPTSVIKTEYSTFTYFITSLDGSQTVTSTDIVVSSNVVTETLNKAQATPILQATPLASAIFVSQYSNLFSTKDVSIF